MIDRSDPRQPFRQVADALRQQILTGELAPGSKLPSIRSLEQTYDVSPTTVQRALRTLKAEGLVVGAQGTGTFVRERRPHVHQSASYTTRRGDEARLTWAEDAARQGMVGTQTIGFVGTVEAPADVAARLDMEEGDPVAVRRRIILLDGDRVQLADSYFPPRIAAGTDLASPKKIRGGTPAALERLGVTLKEFLDEVSFRLATAGETRDLEIPEGSWVIQILRTTYDVSDVPVEVDRMIMLPERHVLRYRLPSQI